jgi:hypothetical protein
MSPACNEQAGLNSGAPGKVLLEFVPEKELHPEQLLPQIS